MGVIEILLAVIGILIAAIPVVGSVKKQQGRREGKRQAENKRRAETMKAQAKLLEEMQEIKEYDQDANNMSTGDVIDKLWSQSGNSN